jgi:hypothetical protein
MVLWKFQAVTEPENLNLLEMSYDAQWRQTRGLQEQLVQNLLDHALESRDLSASELRSLELDWSAVSRLQGGRTGYSVEGQE